MFLYSVTVIVSLILISFLIAYIHETVKEMKANPHESNGDVRIFAALLGASFILPILPYLCMLEYVAPNWEWEFSFSSIGIAAVLLIACPSLMALCIATYALKEDQLDKRFDSWNIETAVTFIVWLICAYILSIPPAYFLYANFFPFNWWDWQSLLITAFVIVVISYWLYGVIKHENIKHNYKRFIFYCAIAFFVLAGLLLNDIRIFSQKWDFAYTNYQIVIKQQSIWKLYFTLKAKLSEVSALRNSYLAEINEMENFVKNEAEKRQIDNLEKAKADDIISNRIISISRKKAYAAKLASIEVSLNAGIQDAFNMSSKLYDDSRMLKVMPKDEVRQLIREINQVINNARSQAGEIKININENDLPSFDEVWKGIYNKSSSSGSAANVQSKPVPAKPVPQARKH